MELKRRLRSYATVVSPNTIPDSRPKWAKPFPIWLISGSLHPAPTTTTNLGCLLFLLSTISKLAAIFCTRRFYRLFAPWETVWHYLYPTSPLARTKMAGIAWIRFIKDGKSLITQGSMSHLFRYSVKCIDVARTTKKSFVQNDDEHDPHRRQEMKVRFTNEHDKIHVLKKTST